MRFLVVWFLTAFVAGAIAPWALAADKAVDSMVTTSDAAPEAPAAHAEDPHVKRFCESTHEGSYVVDYHLAARTDQSDGHAPSTQHVRVNLFCKGTSQIIANLSLVECNGEYVSAMSDLWVTQSIEDGKNVFLQVSNIPEDPSQSGSDAIPANLMIDFKKLISGDGLHAKYTKNAVVGVMEPSTCKNTKAFQPFPKLVKQSIRTVGPEDPVGVYTVTLDSQSPSKTSAKKAAKNSSSIDGKLTIAKLSENNYVVSVRGRSFADASIGDDDGTLQATVTQGSAYKTAWALGQVRIQWTGKTGDDGEKSGKLFVILPGTGLVTGRISADDEADERLSDFKLSGAAHASKPNDGSLAGGDDDDK